MAIRTRAATPEEAARVIMRCILRESKISQFAFFVQRQGKEFGEEVKAEIRKAKAKK